jgi:hypothetical protein
MQIMLKKVEIEVNVHKTVVNSKEKIELCTLTFIPLSIEVFIVYSVIRYNSGVVQALLCAKISDVTVLRSKLELCLCKRQPVYHQTQTG